MFQDRIVFVVTCLTASLAITACGGPADAPVVPEPPAPVMQGTQLQFASGHPQLARLGLATVEEARPIVIDMPARLVWNEDRTQRVQPAFAGRIERILVDVGQSVRAGTPLARLASPDFGVAQADAAKGRADLSLAQKNLQRVRELHEAGVVARKELEQAEADAARAQAEAQRAQARTQLYGASASVDQQLVLSASMAGVVVERNLNPGQELRTDAAAAPLFVISDPSSLWVQIDVRESDIDALRPGASFDLVVPALGSQSFSGRVTAMADVIDANSRTLKVRGVVANPQRLLKAEMLATARVTKTLAQGWVVPAAAVQLRGSTHWVMVQAAPGAFEPREVSLAWLGPKEVVVSKGLRTGEQVVTDNLLMLARQYGQVRDAAGVRP